MFKGLDFKKDLLPYLVAVVVFFAISVIYCSPVLEGKQLFQLDGRKGAGMGQDIKKFKEETGEKSLWSGSMFGGMPAYQISPSYKAFPFSKLRSVFQGELPDPASHLFLYMFGFFILMCAFGVNPWIGIIGAIAFAFSSYFIIIITAGHIWKVWALGLIPPTFAGVIWAYKGKYLKGAAVFGLFFALQLLANHIQMTYYFFVFAGIPYLVYELVEAIKKKKYLHFSKASGALLLGAILAVGINITNLFFTAEYSKDTIRGKSELTMNAADKTSGLDKSYATDWSYGLAETFSLLVPDIKGGGNAAIGNDSKLMEKVDPSFRQDVANSDRYWGDQPFTAGPVYVGAFILFLFLFGLFAVESGVKWSLLFATVISILLAWGKNWMPLTDLFLEYFPMYNKFRTVSSILIVAELCIPILAILALSGIIKKPEILKEKAKGFWISVGLTGGLAFLFWVAPRLFFNFFSQRETDQFAQMLQQNPNAAAQINMYMSGLESARVAILQSDALRSFFVVALGIGALLLYQRNKIKKSLLIGMIGVLVLADLWSIDKRYLNDSHFVPKRETVVAWKATDADKIIMQDKDFGYRVLNMTVSPFQDASTSFYHRSVGGYHAAKLRRYQDVIDHYFTSNLNMPILNMLNTRYFIVPNEAKQPVVQRNPEALGAAWFVGGFRMVNNPDEEIAAIGHFNPAQELILDKRFEEQVGGKSFTKDTTSKIALVGYVPNHLTYKTHTTKEQLAVFSEIYYANGWQASIDGKDVPHFRANYILRAMVIPAGDHSVEFKFAPKSFDRVENLSLVALVGLIVLILVAFGYDFLKNKKKKEA
ncbi:MAG: YfhO family protein [Bacteroidales bacterium]|nr:YfhO family protein [Bacteroidales bacterium]